MAATVHCIWCTAKAPGMSKLVHKTWCWIYYVWNMSFETWCKEIMFR